MMTLYAKFNWNSCGFQCWDCDIQEFEILSVGPWWLDRFAAVLEMLLLRYKCSYFCGRFGWQGKNWNCKIRTWINVARGGT